MESFTYQEAADTLAVPMGTIMSRLAAARITLASAVTARPAAQEKRQGMNVVWWHKAGYQFVLIGRNPAQQLKKTAQALIQAMLA